MDHLENDSSLLRNQLAAGGATERHFIMVRTILWSLEASPRLSRHPLATPSFAFFIPWSEYICTQNSGPKKQPANYLTWKIIKNGFDSVKSLADPGRVKSTEWYSEFDAACQSLSELSGNQRNDLASLIPDSVFENSLHVTRDSASNITANIADFSDAEFTQALVELSNQAILAGHSSRSFYRALSDLLKTEIGLAESIANAVQGEKGQFTVLIGLTGTTISGDRKSQERLRSYLDRSRLKLECRDRILSPQWEIYRADVERFLKLSEPKFLSDPHSSGSTTGWEAAPRITMTVSTDVTAADGAQASLIASQQVHSFLDSLMTESPEILPDVYPVALAKPRSGGGPATFPLKPSQNFQLRLRPSQVSSELSGGISLASVARRQNNPSTKVALTWTAFESIDLKNRALVAKILSLLSLRENSLSAFTDLHHALSVLSRKSRIHDDNHESFLSKARKRESLLKSNSNIPTDKRVRIADSCQKLRIEADEQKSLAERYRTDYEAAWRQLLGLNLFSPRAGVNITLKEASHLDNPGKWELLVRDFVSAEESSEASTLANIADVVGLGTTYRLSMLSELLRNPSGIVETLKASSGWFEFLLHSMFAVRNMNLHAGESVPGLFSSMAHLGILLFDSTLESLTASFPSSSTMGIKERADLLGNRYNELVGQSSLIGNLCLAELSRIDS